MAGRCMTISVSYIPLRGGLDMVSSAFMVDDGRIIEGQNFEQVFGKQGYRRVDGYERHDGRVLASAADFWLFPVTLTGTVAVGDIVTGAAASAEVIAVEADRLIITALAGSFVNGETISVLAVPVGTAGACELGGMDGRDTYLKLAQAAQREKIEAVPGSGSVLGVAVYRGVVYAVRNAADGLTAALYKSTSAGWSFIRGGFMPSGNWRFDVANFTGDSADMALYGCDGKTGIIKYDGERCSLVGSQVHARSVTSQTPATGAKTLTITGGTFKTGATVYLWSAADTTHNMTATVAGLTGDQLVLNVTTANGTAAKTDWCISPHLLGQVYGSQGCSGTSLTVEIGSKTLVVPETLRDWKSGTPLTCRSVSNHANSMTGTVTSYSGTTLVLDVTSVTGSGTVDDWIIGMTDFSDKPYDVVAHSSHLFLSYQNGQLQHSDIGNPMTYTTTAGLFGLGDTITGFSPVKGGVLAIFCRNKTHLLYGSNTTNWELKLHAEDAGALFGTAIGVSGSAVGIDDRGIVSLQSSDTYGDFESANLSRMVKPRMPSLMAKMVGTKVFKTKNQIRVYCNDGTGLSATMLNPSTLLDPETIAITPFAYTHNVTALCSGEDSDGTEAQYFGTSDGYVMREDSGRNFDGQAITATMRLPFIHLKSPANKKRFRKLVLEMDAAQAVSVLYRQLMDYGDDYYAAGSVMTGDFNAGGGVYDVATWDSFRWSAPIYGQAEANIDGVGRNMSLLIWHEDDFTPAFTLQGLLLHYSILGLAR